MRENNKRAGFLDEVRGFAILCMVVYHVMFLLKFQFEVDVKIFFESWFSYIQSFFAGTFIFISGTVCRYSKNNIKRGAQCFLLGMVVTFVVALFVPQFPILFGILHFMGICMILFGLGEKMWDYIPAFIGIIICVALFVLTFNVRNGYLGFGELSIALPDMLYEARLLFPLGFRYKGFDSADYFPLFPWMFLFFAGGYFGVYVKNNQMPAFFYKTRVRFLAATGRYTIWIYLLHQPIAFLILSIIFRNSEV
ncbi:MAG: DUF1624 domain-containing protein [Oscillospiraceae bacterium]|nr:DUF1624 domain-containing protein [Oscillospiraceae bacterium]